MAYNYMLLFIFVSSSSQNLNNDLWSKSQGYAANKVARVMFKSFHFFKMKIKNQFSETDTSVAKMKVSTLKKKILSQRVIFYTYGSSPQTHSTACSLLQPFPWGGGTPQTLVLTGVPMDQDMKCWTTIKS